MAKLEITIPMALQVVVEDVGWWEKSHPVGPNSPFRSGLKRRHHPSDYLALVHLAKQLNMRPLLAFVACEWDRSNLLKRVPTSTWMGADWDNRRNVGPWLDQAAQILNDHRERFEIGLHAVGHEYWDQGRRKRTEFHTEQGEIRPREHIEAHLDAFARIMEQNGLESQPQSFVPPGLNHSFGNGPRGIHHILNRHGIRYVTTDLNKAKMHRPRQHLLMAWEEGVLLIERGKAPVPWHVIAAPYAIRLRPAGVESSLGEPARRRRSTQPGCGPAMGRFHKKRPRPPETDAGTGHGHMLVSIRLSPFGTHSPRRPWRCRRASRAAQAAAKDMAKAIFHPRRIIRAGPLAGRRRADCRCAISSGRYSTNCHQA